MLSSVTKKTAAAICLLISASLAAANYYVSVNGNDGAAGDKSSPFKTVAAAVAKAAAGDSIVVNAGTYTCAATIALSKSGTAEKRVYLFAAEGERPVLDFSSMAVESSNQGVKLSGSYWHIRGLRIKGAGDNGLLVQGGSNNIIEFCDFFENRDAGCQLKGGAANNKIINCDSYYNCDPDEGDADGFAPKMDVGSGNSFYGCRAWQNSDDGWDGYLRGTDNVNTRIENCWCFKNGYHKDGSAGTGNGNGFKIGGSDDKTLKHNFTLIRCLAFSNRVKGFDQNNNRGAMTLYNCTAYSNGTNYSIDGSSSTLAAVNCIAAGTGSNSLKGGTQTTCNLNVAASNFSSVDPSSATAARKADGSLPDITFMHPAEGSSLVNAGTVVDGVEYSGSKPDLGCFETGGLVSVNCRIKTGITGAETARLVRSGSSLLIKINSSSEKKLNIKLVAANGVCIWKGTANTVNHGTAEIMLPFEKLPPGAYFVSTGLSILKVTDFTK